MSKIIDKAMLNHCQQTENKFPLKTQKNNAVKNKNYVSYALSALIISKHSHIFDKYILYFCVTCSLQISHSLISKQDFFLFVAGKDVDCGLN